MDLSAGVVVLGIQGARESYQPIRSPLVASSEPCAVAEALARAANTRELYVADLDAITSSVAPNWCVLEALASAGHTLWVDAGQVQPQQGEKLLSKLPTARWIVPLECVRNFDELPSLFKIAPDRTVFSLDLREGKPVMAAPTRATPQQIVQQVMEAGCRSLIVLDVAAVGAGSGPVTGPLCHRLSTTFPQLELAAGGGVRDAQDVLTLGQAGCRRVLVASALHEGSVSSA